MMNHGCGRKLVLGVAAGGALAMASAAGAQEVLFALNDYISPNLLQIDPADGSQLGSKVVTGQESLFGGLAMDETGRLYSIDGYNDGNSDRLFRINAESGEGEVVGDTGFNWNFRSLSFDATTRTMYAATDNFLFTIDLATGAATQVGQITGDTLDQLTAMVVDANGNAYITDIGDTGLFALDLSSGQTKHLGDIGGGGNWFDDLAFDADGTLWGSRVQGGLYTIDIDTASQTFKYNGTYRGLVFGGATDVCYPDFNGDNTLDLFDFLAFVNEFNAGNLHADCEENGALDLFDFLCYVNAFNAGC